MHSVSHLTSIIVNCDANPQIPSGLSLIGEGTKHCKMGEITLEKRGVKLYANGVQVVHYFSPNQPNGRVIQGNKLHEELELNGVKALNACIMDALLLNQQLIPVEWKNKNTYFRGTRFGYGNGYLCEEYLGWLAGWWRRRYNWLGHDRGEDDPTAALES